MKQKVQRDALHRLIAAVRRDIDVGDTLCGLCPFYQFEHGCQLVSDERYPLPCAELEHLLEHMQEEAEC